MRAIVLVLIVLTVDGCASHPNMDEIYRAAAEEQPATADQQAHVDAKYQLVDALEANPDLPAWQEQRQELALAVGDRRFEQPFDKVYDALIVALASLGCRVNQTERVSGYIAASGQPALPREQKQALDTEALRQFALAKGYAASVVEPTADPEDDPINVNAMTARFFGGVTLSLIRQGDAASKAKLRFTEVYYPALVEAYYAEVWRAVDRQLFLDESLD